MRGRKQFVGLVVASLAVSMGVVGATVAPAGAADTITFRAAAQAAVEPNHRTG